MNSDIKPSTIMLIAGGALMLISTFLTWFDWPGTGGDFSGLGTSGFGLLGIFVALIGIAVAGGTIATKFAGVSLPDRVIGFTITQLYCSLGSSAFLITFGLQFSDVSGNGIFLAWIASAVVVAGAIMDMQAEGSGAAPAAPPSQF